MTKYINFCHVIHVIYSLNAIRLIYRTYSICRAIMENDEISFGHYTIQKLKHRDYTFYTIYLHKMLCIHEKRKCICTICNDCGHGKLKRLCKECGGSSLCEHGKRKSNCRDCGGASICEHNKLRYRCKECGGVSICEHGRQKTRCKECGGGSICEHNKRRSDCRECEGSGFCIHNRRKYHCNECAGGSMCMHGKRKALCLECGGSYYCEHKKLKQNCKECNGGSICIHGKRKSRCKPCGGGDLCKNEWCETFSHTKYDGYCMPCFVNNPENHNKPAMRNYKTKEKAVADFIISNYPNFSWMTDKRILDGCSNRRPDLLLDMGSHVIIVEIDENQHNDYDCSCENKRLMLLSQDVGHRPIVFIRFNPDDYLNETGEPVKSCWKLNGKGIMGITKSKQKEWDLRLENLKTQVQYWIENPTEKTVEVIQLYYNV